MGFFFWLLCSIVIVALVLLLFPFSFRIDFEAGERGARAFFFFFKKKIYEAEKKWGENSRKLEVGSRKDEVGSGECHPERNEVKSKDLERREGTDESHPESSSKQSEGDPVNSSSGGENVPVAEVVAKKPTETPKNECHSERNEVKSKNLERREGTDERRETGDERREGTDESHPESSSKQSEGDPVNSSSGGENVPATEVVAKKPKRKLSDREFWTILLTPDLDKRAFRYSLKILSSVFNLFRVKFVDCFVEGIRTDYQTMGYIAAVNGFLKAYPYVGDWDLQMDWCHEKELRAAGSIHLNITLLRIFCFTLETLVLAGILAISFWRRRAHVIKTNELPDLGFVRRKIIDFIVEE